MAVQLAQNKKQKYNYTCDRMKKLTSYKQKEKKT